MALVVEGSGRHSAFCNGLFCNRTRNLPCTVICARLHWRYHPGQLTIHKAEKKAYVTGGIEFGRRTELRIWRHPLCAETTNKPWSTGMGPGMYYETEGLLSYWQPTDDNPSRALIMVAVNRMMQRTIPCPRTSLRLRLPQAHDMSNNHNDLPKDLASPGHPTFVDQLCLPFLDVHPR